MDLQKYLNNMDHIDVLLIIAVIVLLYVALSGNFEYYSASEELNNESYAPVKYKEEGHDEGLYKFKPLEVDKILTQEKGDALPCSGGDEPPCEYDNPNDVGIAPVDYDNKNNISSENKPFGVVGIMDQTDNMGINIQDMDKPLSAPGMSVFNSSYGSIGDTPPQNIMNSMREQQLQMDTLNLLQHDVHDDQETLINQDQSNGFFAHVGEELHHLGQDVTSGLGFKGVDSKKPSDKPSGDSVKVSLVHAEWCGYCKKALPEWNKVKGDHHGKDINGFKMHMEDFEEKKDAHLIGKGKKFEVDGFPTFFLTQVKDGVEQQPVTFNAITYDTILDKIKELTGKL